MVETKEIQIKWDGSPATVKLQQFTYGIRNELLDLSTETSMVDGKSNVLMNFRKLKEFALLKGIVEAPFEINIKCIRDLPVTMGDLLYAELDKLNTTQEEKKVD